MRAALLLIDVQHDYLQLPGIEPPCAYLCESLAQLLSACRVANVPVIHVWTHIHHPEERMPHWIRQGISRCVAYSPGAETPESLKPLASETIVHKRFYSAFADSSLAEQLRQAGVDTVLLCGLLLRACVRTTAIDAYQNGFSVLIGDDAVADDDPIHAAVTRRYLQDRIARFVSVSELCRNLAQSSATLSEQDESRAKILSGLLLDNQARDVTGTDLRNHASPRDTREILWRLPISAREHASLATCAARRCWRDWQAVPLSQRISYLSQLADRIVDETTSWACQIAQETGKPMRDAVLEVAFTAALIRAAIQVATASDPPVQGQEWRLRRRALGVVAIITPWNNPLAIPLGKLAPALLYGNTVVWKPAIPGAAIAVRVFDLLRECGLPPGVVNVVQGDRTTAQALMEDPEVDAVSLTGSSSAGYMAQAVCARRRIPLQAELGGNNAAIVWFDANLDKAAEQIVQGGFGSAGQRCTANRRVIVAHSVYQAFIERLRVAMRKLPVGDPLDNTTVVGPVISQAALYRISAVIDRARRAGAEIIVEPMLTTDAQIGLLHGCYYPPTLVCCSDPSAEIVQEETFGPVIVVQSAKDWRQAIGLCNSVRQGLVATIFTQSIELQQQFLDEARAGLLKINTATAGAAADAPFGGWKDSGIGPPEHGIADIQFYTLQQTVYPLNG